MDLQQRAPPLRPQRGKKLPALKSSKGGVYEEVLGSMAGRIKELEKTIKKCDVVLSKGERVEMRKRRKRLKVMGSEGWGQVVGRVFYEEVQKRKEKEEERAKEHLGKRHALQKTEEEIEEIVARVYEDALTKKQELEDSQSNMLTTQSQVPTLLLDPHALQEISSRLSTQEIVSRKARYTLLKNRYSPPSPPAHTFTKEEQTLSNTRLYTDPLTKSTQRRQQLRSRYTPEPEPKRLTPGQQANMVSRLFK